ncbi:class I SAM-dependent methyltransferase [Tenacibaculum agarivorans]|uniref:class I SAM-dependent methyltransferase n=1 Tax=Tenacibaculum agarivorans TaxID=1908389 RepID=UPI00094B96A2|nr:class I SAM-dependent methyltransferase [Tenacibaculum agarivorans]
MYFFSTEVTSSKIISDRPLYLRTKKAYEIVKNLAFGNTLEIGCGEGYGVDIYYNYISNLTLIDKSNYPVELLRKKYPDASVIRQKVPPLKNIPDNYFDTIIAFQVIEHIKNDNLFLDEIYRVLKPGGKVYITTPNANKTIARNPWHYREYNFLELENLVQRYFSQFTIQGIEGNYKTAQYYSNNERSVKKLLRLDLFNLHKKLPAFILKIPYEILNRLNRKKLLKQQITEITIDDYSLNSFSENTLDFFCMLTK